MLDRESTFADENIVTLLKTRFVPVAIDQAYQRRQRDAEGDFYRQIAKQGPRGDNFQQTTQGLYIATAGGKLLGFSNNRDPRRIEKMIAGALDDFQPEKTAVIERGRRDARYSPTPPEGGLVVRVRAKVLSGYPETENRWRRIFQSALSRDNLWITRAEHRALAGGVVPESLQRRIARYHLVDNTRGEPPMWRDEEVRQVSLSIKNGVLTGNADLQTRSGDRSFKPAFYGVVEATDGKVTRFDLVATGMFEGEGRFTRNAPPGKFPLAIAFTLADGADVADKVPPQGSRGWVDGYLRNR